MITKERLEELIEQEANVYECVFYGINTIQLKKGDYVEENGTLHTQEPYGGFRFFYDDRLFETKEDAEFIVKMHTKRTEYFEPPTWEEFEREHKPYRFISKGGLRETIYIFDKNVNNKLLSAGSRFFGKPTKENYIKACEYARSLFLGEENV